MSDLPPRTITVGELRRLLAEHADEDFVYLRCENAAGFLQEPVEHLSADNVIMPKRRGIALETRWVRARGRYDAD